MCGCCEGPVTILAAADTLSGHQGAWCVLATGDLISRDIRDNLLLSPSLTAVIQGSSGLDVKRPFQSECRVNLE